MIHERLKTLSRPFHDHLESHPINQNLFSKNASASDYYQFLSLQYSLFLPIEVKLFDFIPDFFHYGITFHSRAIEAEHELTSLNLPLPEIRFDASSITDFTSALASLYILEGSRHGAIVILKTIRPLMLPEHPFLFLKTDPSAFMAEWKSIIKVMQEYTSTRTLEDTLILNVCQLYLEIERFYNEYHM